MRRRQNHWPDFRQVEPKRQLSTQHTATVGTAAARHDLHAAQSVGMGSSQKRAQRVKRMLRRHAMQIELSCAAQLAAVKSLPGGGIDPRRLAANTDRRRPDRRRCDDRY
jgi:hypothetical protein